MRRSVIRRKNKVYTFMLAVQRNLRHTRKKNNLTQSQLGAKLNVDQATISNFENGKTIMNIAQIYEMYLIFGSDFCCPNIEFIENVEGEGKVNGKGSYQSQLYRTI
ncbi:helix-turn-helix transcriptional regulator [Pseudoalteromonas luteoviolacea]|uniref:helix-turn-helix domain-containing protein n=1 Tax=Pseudoalteromonas luteoviolacea TaxID=43657 RepID=UPI001B3617C4|nr:helix-turn-helix transcriptional regulator [Pseudoalteromonas luteoviolacea]MBQ4813125.1 helix-turn-helix transcriptional regulator [Pseudoalteromonas luteoviolacea]